MNLNLKDLSLPSSVLDLECTCVATRRPPAIRSVLRSRSTRLRRSVPPVSRTMLWSLASDRAWTMMKLATLIKNIKFNKTKSLRIKSIFGHNLEYGNLILNIGQEKDGFYMESTLLKVKYLVNIRTMQSSPLP